MDAPEYRAVVDLLDELHEATIKRKVTVQVDAGMLVAASIEDADRGGLVFELVWNEQTRRWQISNQAPRPWRGD
jgi:hypothetical protein